MIPGFTLRKDIITKFGNEIPAPVILHWIHKLKYRANTAKKMNATTTTMKNVKICQVGIVAVPVLRKSIWQVSQRSEVSYDGSFSDL